MKNTEMVKFAVNGHTESFNLDAIHSLVNDYNKAVKARRGKDTIPTKNALEKMATIYAVDVEDVPALYTGMSQYLKEQESKESKEQENAENKLYKRISEYVKENNELPNDNALSIMFSECSIVYDNKEAEKVRESYLKLAKTGKYALVVTESPKKDIEANKAYNSKLPSTSVVQNDTSADDKARALVEANKHKEEQEKQLKALEQEREKLIQNNCKTMYIVNNGLNIFDKTCKPMTAHIALFFQRQTMKEVLSTRWNAIKKHYIKEVDNWNDAIKEAESTGNDKALESAKMNYHNTVHDYEKLEERYKEASRQISKVWNKNTSDRCLESAIKNGKDIRTAIRSFFLEYGIDVNPNGKFMNMFFETVNSKDKNRDKLSFYRDGKAFDSNTKALEQVYLTMFGILFKSGIIKKCGIPNDIMVALEAIHDKDKEYTYYDVPATFDDLEMIFQKIDPTLAEIDRKIECTKNALRVSK